MTLFSLLLSDEASLTLFWKHWRPSGMFLPKTTISLDDEQLKFDKETVRAEMRNADASAISTSQYCSDVLAGPT